MLNQAKNSAGCCTVISLFTTHVFTHPLTHRSQIHLAQAADQGHTCRHVHDENTRITADVNFAVDAVLCLNAVVPAAQVFGVGTHSAGAKLCRHHPAEVLATLDRSSHGRLHGCLTAMLHAGSGLQLASTSGWKSLLNRKSA